jgi:hypothetical protein
MSEENTEQVEGPFSRFKLVRTTDVTGISGTGVIAYGIQWPDQSCHLYWLKHGTHGYYPNIGVLRDVHCYSVNGTPNATIEWIAGDL